MPPLTSSQVRALRAQGHHLDPVVMVGQSGIHDAVVAKVCAELAVHELIKVRVGQGVGRTRELAAALAAAAEAELVQVLGRTMLLYKERPPEEEKEKPPER